MKIRHWLLLLILMLGIAALTYFIGRQSGSVKITHIATNELLIKQIAELSSLEVQGNAQIAQTNLTNDGSWTDAVRKLFIENTVTISIPYIAKYGVSMDTNDLKITQKDNVVSIHLPEPKLLSFEMRLDKANSSSTQGWMQAQSNDLYNQVQKKLYQQSRTEMEQSTKNKELAKEKIITILKSYYQPLGYQVELSFGSTQSISLFPKS
ncbi:DUF4230 domain-containing protein [Taibaiella sp. KBW10]|uniref:DUF4230 domain-containing protein n=1 Tax=Taibaiella sp. KBW10 TaxID=2153357 RepID=UPI000F59C5AD|nr:DUF4230 domain-containing protein [Taibaiella sp. KBW10]RQO31638.1 DUF4230 domain-containing protein [Taibaiella sp. KBW10]